MYIFRKAQNVLNLLKNIYICTFFVSTCLPSTLKVHMLLSGGNFTFISVWFLIELTVLIFKVLFWGVSRAMFLHILVFQLRSCSILLSQSLSLFNSPFEKHVSVALLIIIREVLFLVTCFTELYLLHSIIFFSEEKIMKYIKANIDSQVWLCWHNIF